MYKYLFYTFFKISYHNFFKLEDRGFTIIFMSFRVEHFIVVPTIYLQTILRASNPILPDTLKGVWCLTFKYWTPWISSFFPSIYIETFHDFLFINHIYIFFKNCFSTIYITSFSTRVGREKISYEKKEQEDEFWERITGEKCFGCASL